MLLKAFSWKQLEYNLIVRIGNVFSSIFLCAKLNTRLSPIPFTERAQHQLYALTLAIEKCYPCGIWLLLEPMSISYIF